MNGAHAKSRTQALKLGSYLAGMGLLEKTKSGKYTPSKAGNQYIDSYSAVPIQNALRKNLKYISEIEQLLADRQLTISSLKTELAEKYEINWKSDWQIRFRLNWMRAFDMAERLTEKQSTGRYPEWRLR